MEILKVDNIFVQDLINFAVDTFHSPWFVLFLMLMVIDIFSGYFKAFIQKKWNSRTGTDGLLRHFMVFLLIVFVGIGARIFNARSFSVLWCIFFIINYIGSIIENVEGMGIELPTWLKPITNMMKEATNKKVAEVIKVDTLEYNKIEPKKNEDAQ